MSAALEVDVTRHIGEFDLNATFTLESGTLVLFGPSGAGKSLTLALIAGLIKPDSGTIAINGALVTDCASGIHITTQQRHIGMAFQDGLLLPHRDVLDNVALAVRQASRRRDRRAIAHTWLERVGADELSDRRPGSLSGGQRQRVALARAFAGEPSLVLLDEPLSALDSVVRRELRHLIRQVAVSSGIPAVLVTHDAEEAEELGDVITSINDGRVSSTRQVLRPAADPESEPPTNDGST
ncbi:MAG: ATP-binding cassette domain-containing protein [Acidimicrobiales bacterium]